MTKVLFTGGGGVGNEAIWRLLNHRYELHFGDADSFSIDPSIPKDRRHQLPWASELNFVNKIVEICRRLKIDVLVPSVDEELVALAMGVNILRPTRLLLPNVDYINTMLDKLNMIKALSEKKIKVPYSRTIADGSGDFSFPCISKPRNGRGSRDVRILKCGEEVHALRLAVGDAARSILLQEKIEGVEYTVQMVADDKGRLHAVVPVRIDIKRGITLRAETENELRVIDVCKEIHKAIPASGCYNIQLILTHDGNVIPFEINPRVSTTLCLTIAAGIDPIGIFLGQIQSNNLLPFISGIKLKRHWRNFFSNLSIPS